MKTRIERKLLVAVCIVPLAALAFAVFTPNFCLAQQKPDLVGDYAGLLGPYHVKLHLIVSRDGTLTGTADNPDGGLFGMQCTDLHINGQALSFTVPVVHGTWSGVTDENGTSLSGMWSQDSGPTPLNFTRITAADAEGTAKATAGIGAGRGGDFVQDGLKFHRVGGFIQVVDIAKSQSAGTIMFPPGQSMMVAAMPGYDAAIKAAYEKHANGGGSAQPTEVARNVPPATQPAGSAPTGVATTQQDLQGYEGSLGSLGDAQILLPGNSIQTPEGGLKNESDSNRAIVYFPRTHEKVSFSSSKSSDHKDDVVVLAGNFGASKRPAYVASTLGAGQGTPQYTEYLIHFTGGNSNLKHMFGGTFKSQTVDRARAGSSALVTDSRAHTASFTISTIDSNGHLHESLSSRQVDDWMNTTATSRGLGVDPGAARAAGLVVVADQALVDQGKENPDLRHVKKDYGIGEALKNDLRYFAFGAGALDKPGDQEKRDQRIGATTGALGTTSPSTPSPQ